jgi:hypothetical protein
MIMRATEREKVFEVEVQRVFFEEDPDEPVSWAAEWAPQGSSSATEDNTEDLADLVAAIVHDARAAARRHGCPVRIGWRLVGDAPPGGTVADAVIAEGVTLPERVIPE